MKSLLLNERITTALLKDLNDFGLNPSDWRLIPQSTNQYRIESIHDDHFLFVGRVFRKGTKVSWDQISLVEI